MAERREPGAVVGVFQDRQAAEQAVGELQRAGFDDDQIGFAVRGEKPAEKTSSPESEDTLTEESAGGGAISGGVLGGAAGAVATGLIPGIGPVIAVGALSAIVGGAAAGAAVGGIAGALAGKGVPEDEAQVYDEEFRAGHSIVTVEAEGRQAEARNILRERGAYDAHTRPTS